MRGAIIAASLALFSLGAGAQCVCRCVNGSVQPVCRSSIDLPPVCMPAVCPITPPAISPMQMPQLPPLGTSNCRQVQILNPYNGQYQWRTVCN
jgi:hypothetical protein